MASKALLYVFPSRKPVPIEEIPKAEEIESERYELTGDTQQDAETALRAIAFLIDFMNVVGADEFRRVAGVLCGFREDFDGR